MLAAYDGLPTDGRSVDAMVVGWWLVWDLTICKISVTFKMSLAQCYFARIIIASVYYLLPLC